MVVLSPWVVSGGKHCKDRSLERVRDLKTLYEALWIGKFASRREYGQG